MLLFTFIDIPGCSNRMMPYFLKNVAATDDEQRGQND
jgi:hypothetical protein